MSASSDFGAQVHHRAVELFRLFMDSNPSAYPPDEYNRCLEQAKANPGFVNPCFIEVAAQQVREENTETALLDAMRAHGGHFASRLAEAWGYADGSNRAKLRLAFGTLLESYRKFLPSDRE